MLGLLIFFQFSVWHFSRLKESQLVPLSRCHFPLSIWLQAKWRSSAWEITLVLVAWWMHAWTAASARRDKNRSVPRWIRWLVSAEQQTVSEAPRGWSLVRAVLCCWEQVVGDVNHQTVSHFRCISWVIGGKQQMINIYHHSVVNDCFLYAEPASFQHVGKRFGFITAHLRWPYRGWPQRTRKSHHVGGRSLVLP